MCLLCFLFGFAIGQPDPPKLTPQQELTEYLAGGYCPCPWDTKRYAASWPLVCKKAYCSRLEKAFNERPAP